MVVGGSSDVIKDGGDCVAPVQAARRSTTKSFWWVWYYGGGSWVLYACGCQPGEEEILERAMGKDNDRVSKDLWQGWDALVDGGVVLGDTIQTGPDGHALGGAMHLLGTSKQDTLFLDWYDRVTTVEKGLNEDRGGTNHGNNFHLLLCCGSDSGRRDPGIIMVQCGLSNVKLDNVC